MGTLKLKTMSILACLSCMGAAMLSATEPASPKTALVMTGKKYFESWLKPMLKPTGLVMTQYDLRSDSKKWKEQGFVFPKYDELKKYDLVIIQGGNLLKEAKTDFIKYLENGGTIFMIYTSLPITKEKTGELAFGVGGFDGIKAIHEVPYTQKVKLKHPLKYTKKMGQEREFVYETVYTVYATDLVDAKALVENADNPELVSVCVAKVGKGQFIYSATEETRILIDTLKYAGLAAK